MHWLLYRVNSSIITVSRHDTYLLPCFILFYSYLNISVYLLENLMMAWLWSGPEDFELLFSMLSLRLRDKWNLTNSTLTLSESLRSLSANGDHCASFRPVPNTQFTVVCSIRQFYNNIYLHKINKIILWRKYWLKNHNNKRFKYSRLPLNWTPRDQDLIRITFCLVKPICSLYTLNWTQNTNTSLN